MMKYTRIYLFFLITLILVSCHNHPDVDVSKVQLNLKIERFDQEMASLSPINVATKVPALQKKYGRFYNDYMERMLEVGSTSDTAYYKLLRVILQNKDYLELKSSVASTFPNLDQTEIELNDAFKHIFYYYPKQKPPRLITFLSGFAVQTPIGNDYIGIGLDMFLGADSKFYPALRQNLPQYITRRFTPQNITPRVVEVFIRENMFPEEDKDRSLLSKAVYNGKILYCMGAMMPNVADTLKIGYKTKQLEWCKNNEASIWAYFLDNDLLYETDYLKIQKYLSEAPFTPGLGSQSESAPKLGVWIGWQIVKRYMDKNPKMTLQQLMAEKDAQRILRLSNYKPK